MQNISIRLQTIHINNQSRFTKKERKKNAEEPSKERKTGLLSQAELCFCNMRKKNFLHA